jgi:hypothetical protein
MKRIVKKLYRDCVEVRDYDVQDCIQRNENMTIEYDRDIMTLSPNELINKMVSKSSKTFPSKMGGKDYKLCSYYWEPDPVEL